MELPGLDFNVVACHISSGANGEENDIVAIFNPRKSETAVTLPEGEWTIYVNAQDAGNKALGKAEGEVTVEPISAMVLVKGDWIDPALAQEILNANGGTLPVVLGALTGVLVCTYIFNKKRKQ